MSDLDPFRHNISPKQWTADFESFLRLPVRTEPECKRLLTELHAGADFCTEYATRLWAAYRYLVLHQEDWVKVGLQTGTMVKRSVLISLRQHFATVDLPHCGMMDFPVSTFIYGANRAVKDLS